MTVYRKSLLNKVVRGANRATYDQEQVHQILDSGFVCHVGFVMDHQPCIIPTAYVRDGETLFIHGSVKSRMIQAIQSGEPICLTVTHLDGLVLARSAFHHSVNYRSVVVYGNARLVTDDLEKNRVLGLITDHILEGRWDEVRKPNQKELDVTAVLAISMDVVSAKVRLGGPVDDSDDYDLDIWAGLIPISQSYGTAIPDEKLKEGVVMSPSVLACDSSSQ